MPHAVRNYAIVTAAYWGFTLTDGALRMLVLLHFYRLGYSPFTLAFLFLLYEAAGVVANLIGGWLATRYGIARMLMVGLTTQIIGFTLLSLLNPEWTAALSVAWVLVAQGICGVAKDLTKTASKSAIKVPAGLPMVAVADGRAARTGAARRHVFAAADDGQKQGFEISKRTVRQKPGHQCAGRGACRAVRGA
jgi:MFS family permease